MGFVARRHDPIWAELHQIGIVSLRDSVPRAHAREHEISIVML